MLSPSLWGITVAVPSMWSTPLPGDFPGQFVMVSLGKALSNISMKVLTMIGIQGWMCVFVYECGEWINHCIVLLMFAWLQIFWIIQIVMKDGWVWVENIKVKPKEKNRSIFTLQFKPCTSTKNKNLNIKCIKCNTTSISINLCPMFHLKQKCF